MASLAEPRLKICRILRHIFCMTTCESSLQRRTLMVKTSRITVLGSQHGISLSATRLALAPKYQWLAAEVMTRSAGQEGSSCKARERRTSRASSSERKAADGPFLARPQGVHTAPHCRVGSAWRNALCLRSTALHCNAVCALSASLLLPRATRHRRHGGRLACCA